jgi:7,8-dihydropterin-6-yl-methyl-4-(beta-D-ribofuranosyl)aminobenzene 5'-phosphate synthase
MLFVAIFFNINIKVCEHLFILKLFKLILNKIFTMIISVLTDNKPGSDTAAEHGLSYLVEHEGKNLLFDTGQSNLFLKNAKIMGIDLMNIHTIVLSHGHFDHGDGLQYLSGGELICHPGCFVKRYRKSDHYYIGLKVSKKKSAEKFNLHTSSGPYRITENIIFLGEIPRLTDFESKSTPFILDDGIPDFVMDDSAIALILDKGLFVITGCGHAGIVNTLEHAKKVTGENMIYGVMGGFHLKKVDRQTKETIHYLKENRAVHVYPSHCTDKPALGLFHKEFGTKQVRTGDIYTF